MKKIIFSSIILLLSAVLAFSQTISSLDHIHFKGLPVDGTLAQFSTNLEKAGLPVISLDKTSLSAIHHGPFAGYDDCIIDVYSCPKGTSDCVYLIGIAIPLSDDWAQIQSDYQNLKEMLTLKYGKPVSEENTFLKSNSNAINLRRLHSGDASLIAVFHAPGGRIVLSPQMIENSPGLILTYIDSVNEILANESILSDL